MQDTEKMLNDVNTTTKIKINHLERWFITDEVLRVYSVTYKISFATPILFNPFFIHLYVLFNIINHYNYSFLAYSSLTIDKNRLSFHYYSLLKY